VDDPNNAAVKTDIDILLHEIEQEQKAARKDIATYKKNGIIRVYLGPVLSGMSCHYDDHGRAADVCRR
jgi:hypothetical protein